MVWLYVEINKISFHCIGNLKALWIVKRCTSSLSWNIFSYISFDEFIGKILSKINTLPTVVKGTKFVFSTKKYTANKELCDNYQYSKWKRCFILYVHWLHLHWTNSNNIHCAKGRPHSFVAMLLLLS